MIARPPVRRFADERGQSLVLTLLVLFVLAIVLSTLIIFTSSNQRNSNYQKARQTASWQRHNALCLPHKHNLPALAIST